MPSKRMTSSKPFFEASGSISTPCKDKKIQNNHSLQQEELHKEFSSIYEDADDMLQASFIISTFTSLRKLARAGKIPATKDDSATSNSILTLPISSLTAIYFLHEHEELLTKHKYLSKYELEMTKSALNIIHERFHDSFSSRSMIKQEDYPTVVAYGDENTQEELVYAIAVHRRKKRITVSFRGSVTKQDYMVNACVSMKKIPNPLATTADADTDADTNTDERSNKDDQDLYIKLHSGFYNYLMKKGTKKNISKFQEISDILINLFKEYPSFRLYVTGHSLGGALCTLFSFFVAADTIKYKSIPKPIICVSIGSPKVGNESWKKAFQQLESLNMLYHLRVVNTNDPVVLVPPSTLQMLKYFSPVTGFLKSSNSNNSSNSSASRTSSSLASNSYDEIYTHTGMKLKLEMNDKNGVVRAYFSHDKSSNWLQDFTFPSKNNTNAITTGMFQYRVKMFQTKVKKSYFNPQNHFIDKYSRRLFILKEKLMHVQLCDLYSHEISLDDFIFEANDTSYVV